MLRGVVAALAALALAASLQPHSLHSDLAVLQAGQPCLTGAAEPGQPVSLVIVHDSSGRTVARAGPATTDPAGRWRACLTDPIEPSADNHTISFSSGGAVAESRGVLIGNVVVCSGQSNMEKPTSYAFNATGEIAAAERLGGMIRLAGVPGPWNNDASGGAAAEPRVDTKIPMRWRPASVFGFSAVCWMYGRRLLEAYPTVPLGLIESDVGGTNIQAWSPPTVLTACGVAPSRFSPAQRLACPPYCNSSSLYNGMIAPLLQYAIHHVIWYQGESNCGDPHYSCLQQGMVSAWRDGWGRQFGFGFVELAGYRSGPAQPGDNSGLVSADDLPNEPFAARKVAQLRMQQQASRAFSEP